MSILSVSDISKSYDKKKLAVENLSFELNEGDFFGFLDQMEQVNHHNFTFKRSYHSR